MHIHVSLAIANHGMFSKELTLLNYRLAEASQSVPSTSSDTVVATKNISPASKTVSDNNNNATNYTICTIFVDVFEVQKDDVLTENKVCSCSVSMFKVISYSYSVMKKVS